MNEKEKEALKQEIHKEMERLHKEVTRLREFTKPVPPDNAIGRLTRMEAINAKSIAEANMRKARSRIVKLEKTLERINDDPDFGICASCGRPIPMKRIMLVPESTRCVRCLSR